MGNSIKIAGEYYLQVTPEHFRRALKNPVQHPHASGCTEEHGESQTPRNQDVAVAKVGDTGFEPVTSAV
jgi:ribosomal protein L2